MNTPSRRAPAACILLAVLLAPACTHVHRIKVDAAARPDAAAQTSYSVENVSSAKSSPAEREAAQKYVRTALSAKGLYEAPRPAEADMKVVYSYEITPRTRVSEWQEPVTQNIPLPRPLPSLDSNGNVRYPPHTAVPDYARPKRQIVETIYEKTLHIVATERKPAMPDTPARVWDISISYEDQDPGMDKAMPLLAAAGCDRIGTNTDGPITVRLRDKDEVVAFIKRGL